RQAVIGVNRFRPAEEPPLDVLRVSNSAVRSAQIEKLKRLRAERDEGATRAALSALTEGARGSANLLALAVAAARAKATVGEISGAIEAAFGRYAAKPEIVSGVYAAEIGGEVDAIRSTIAGFAANDGRPPRILVAKIGQDGHDRGQKVIASA